jgi:hypothetical protein
MKPASMMSSLLSRRVGASIVTHLALYSSNNNPSFCVFYIGASMIGLATVVCGSILSRNQKYRAAFNSLLYSMKSIHLWNMVLSAFALTYVGRRQGLRFKYIYPMSFSFLWYLYYRFRVVESGECRFQRTFWNVQVMRFFTKKEGQGSSFLYKDLLSTFRKLSVACK